MKVIGSIVLVVSLGLFLWMRSGDTLPTAAPLQTASEYLDLRTRALQFTPSELGLPPEIATDTTWAAIMEIYMEKSGATVTVTSFADGNTSIYLSPGGGYIGGVAKPKIHDAATAFVKAAHDYRSQMTPADEYPLPGPGETVFYVRESERLYRASAATRELDSNRHAFSKLWIAGQEVITQYRLDRDGR